MSNRKTNEPSLSTLSFMLRHKELWPSDFEWDYKFCDRCAIGLTSRIWEKDMPVPAFVDVIGVFGLDNSTATDIFASRGSEVMNMGDVTPEIVANRIDKYLASVE